MTSTKSIVEIISDFFRGSSRPDFNGEWICIATWGFLEVQRSGRHVISIYFLIFDLNLAVYSGLEWCHASIFRATTGSSVLLCVLLGWALLEL